MFTVFVFSPVLLPVLLHSPRVSVFQLSALPPSLAQIVTEARPCWSFSQGLEGLQNLHTPPQAGKLTGLEVANGAAKKKRANSHQQRVAI